MSNLTNSIGFQMNFMQEVLNNWAVQEGGRAVIAKDYVEMYELATNAPGPRCIIVYDGEDIRGDFTYAAVASRVDRRYAVVVSRGQGMTAHRGDALTQPLKGGRPFYDLVEEARDIVRSLLFDASVTEATQNDPVDYKGIEPLAYDGYPLDAYVIRFSIGTQLGMVFAQNLPIIEGLPNPPNNFNIVEIAGAAVLNWTLTSPNTLTTAIQRSTDGVNFSALTSVGQNITTYTDSTGTTGNTYFYRLFNTSTTGNSGFSSVVSITLN